MLLLLSARMCGLPRCLVAKQLREKGAIQNGKEQPLEIVSILTAIVNGLIARIREESGENFDFLEQEKEQEREED